MTLDEFRDGQIMRRASIDELRTDPSYHDGYNEMIRIFRAQITPQDDLYYHCAVQSRWDEGFGSEGFVLFRDGITVDQLLIRMN